MFLPSAFRDFEDNSSVFLLFPSCPRHILEEMRLVERVCGRLRVEHDDLEVLELAIFTSTTPECHEDVEINPNPGVS